MSWSDAKRDADFRLRMILDRIERAPKNERPALIPLTDYEDEAAYAFICGPGWTLDYFRMVNDAVARGLKERGYKVKIVTVNLNEYFAWLIATGAANDSAQRAKFIAEKSWRRSDEAEN